MPQTEAQRRAKDKWNKANTALFSVRIKKAEYDTIYQFCEQNKISKARFLVWATNYFIQRGEVPPDSTVNSDE